MQTEIYNLNFTDPQTLPAHQRQQKALVMDLLTRFSIYIMSVNFKPRTD